MTRTRLPLAAASLMCALASLAGPADAAAQDRPLLFASIGLGRAATSGTTSETAHLGAFVAVTALRDRTLFEVRASNVSEWQILGPSPAESGTDVGLLIGRANVERHTTASAAAGVSWVHLITRGSLVATGFFGSQYQKVTRDVVGIPLELSASVHAGLIGAGVSFAGNVNSANSFASLVFALHVGRLR